MAVPITALAARLQLENTRVKLALCRFYEGRDVMNAVVTIAMLHLWQEMLLEGEPETVMSNRQSHGKRSTLFRGPGVRRRGGRTRLVVRSESGDSGSGTVAAERGRGGQEPGNKKRAGYFASKEGNERLPCAGVWKAN